MITLLPNRPDRQKGAALIVVLLLVATLSFIVLAITSKTVNAVRRSSANIVRNEIYWREIGTEELAAAALNRTINTTGGDVFSDAHPLFAAPISLPLPQGTGTLRFADATRCFNLNSLVIDDGEGGFERNPIAVDEFKSLGVTLGLGDSEAEELADVIVDWIDVDGNQELRGAEDSFYTGLPVPFRTGGTLLASVSELRAMKGVTKELYDGFAPFLCAITTPAPSILNVNFLRPEHAPLLAAALREKIELTAIVDLIAQRPPGGYANKQEFLALPAFAPLNREKESETSTDEEIDAIFERVDVKSSYVEVQVQLEFNGIEMERRLLFSLTPGDDPSLIRRMRGGPDR